MKTLTTLLAVLAMSTLVVSAADPAKPKADPEKAFKKLDANGDGKVTAEEFKASPAAQKDAAKAEASFAKKDKDGDKSLTLEEFSAMGKKKK